MMLRGGRNMAGDGLPPKKIVYVPAIGPRLKKLLFAVFALFAVLVVNSAYLGTITWLESQSGRTLDGCWPAFAACFALAMLAVQAQDPRRWNEKGPASGEKYYFPSLARTATGNFIPARTLQMDGYCRECHQDIHEKWSHSAHRFSS